MHQYSRRFAALAALLAAACQPAPTPPAAEAPAPTSALDTPWVDIGRTPDGGAIAVDRTSKTRTGALGEATVRVKYPLPDVWRAEVPGGYETIAVTAETIRFQFDCEARTMRILERKALDADGGVKQTLSPDEAGAPDPRPVTPGGLAELVLPHACGG